MVGRHHAHQRGVDGARGGVEATAFPLLAESDPAALSFDSGMFRAPQFVLLTGLWLLLPLCFAAIGWLARPTLGQPATALAASGVAFFAFGMWFVPVVGPISSVAFGVVLLWCALSLWRPLVRR